MISKKKEKPAILFLSHQGFSFIDDLISAAKSAGFSAYVLSSLPSSNNMGRLKVLFENTDWFDFTYRPSLTWKDVKNAIQKLADEGRNPTACLTVWEGYRLFMSKANGELLASDLSPVSVEHVIDKYRMRKTLIDAGLSSVQTEVLAYDVLQRVVSNKERKFIKPRIGLASFGAFRANTDLTWDDIVKIGKEMALDPEYQGIFFYDKSKNIEFIAEDYIHGIETSFELIVINSKVFVLAIHEKLETKQDAWTLLENSCVSPPVNVSKADLKQGVNFVTRCFHALKLNTGCFHVEAKFDARTSKWEIIEINPRVGGALIKESVKLQRPEICILTSWIQTLTVKGITEILSLQKRLSKISPKRSTFFRVFFGHPGKTIKDIKIHDIGLNPTNVRVFVKPGTTLPSSSREIFLGQALWRVPASQTKRELDLLNKQTQNFLEVVCA